MERLSRGEPLGLRRAPHPARPVLTPRPGSAGRPGPGRSPWRPPRTPCLPAWLAARCGCRTSPQERGATQVQGARESGQLPPRRHRKSRAQDPGEGPRVSAFVRQGGPAAEGRGRVWEDPFSAKLGQGNPPGNRDRGDGWHSPTPLLLLGSKPKFKWKG